MRIIAPVEMVLRTSFVAVPAFIRVEPVRASGPTLGRTTTSQVARSTWGGSEHETRPVVAPIVWARDNAARPNGVVPPAAPERIDHQVDGPGHVLAHGVDRRGNGAVLGVDQIDDLEARSDIDPLGARIALLSEPRVAVIRGGGGHGGIRMAPS